MTASSTAGSWWEGDSLVQLVRPLLCAWPQGQQHPGQEQAQSSLPSWSTPRAFPEPGALPVLRLLVSSLFLWLLSALGSVSRLLFFCPDPPVTFSFHGNGLPRPEVSRDPRRSPLFRLQRWLFDRSLGPTPQQSYSPSVLSWGATLKDTGRNECMSYRFKFFFFFVLELLNCNKHTSPKCFLPDSPVLEWKTNKQVLCSMSAQPGSKGRLSSAFPLV